MKMLHDHLHAFFIQHIFDSPYLILFVYFANILYIYI